MAHADALSRAPLPFDRAPQPKDPIEPLVYHAFLNTTSPMSLPFSSEISLGRQDLIKEQDRDNKLRPIIAFLTTGKTSNHKKTIRRMDGMAKVYLLHQGVLHHRANVGHQNEFTQVVVPNSLTERMCEAFHSLPLSGHLGLAKTYDRLRSRFY